ncbi:MAG: hypothetical protein ACK5MV_06085 [Aminipila sp.]
MTREEFLNIWNYYLVLEGDLSSTSRFVEPTQKDVFSFEFLKIIILSCSELETTFKYICEEISGSKDNAGNIGQYKNVILKNFPQITEATVKIYRIQESILPFQNWKSGTLSWWNAYQDIKHNRGQAFQNATYWNAVYALSALYILIFYLSQITGFEFNDSESKYLHSEYSSQFLVCRAPKKLPGFEGYC